jgi:hypothetical protein
MKYFDRVTIACDHTAGMLELAMAMRAVLESYTLRVDFHHLIQKRQVLDFFSHPHESDYIVLVTHGHTGNKIVFDVVDQKDDNYAETKGWDSVKFALTPDNIPAIVKNQHGALISIACGGGRPVLASAFLTAGYDAYVGADSSGVDCNAATLFVLGLFYHLIAEAPHIHTLEESVARAAAADPEFEMGTKSFRCWRASDLSPAANGE